MIILLAALAHCPTTKQMNRQCLCYNFCSLSTQCLFSVKLGKGEIVIVCHSCSVSLGFTRTPFTKSLKIVSLVSNDSYAAAVADRRGIHSISTNLLETPYLVGVLYCLFNDALIFIREGRILLFVWQKSPYTVSLDFCFNCLGESNTRGQCEYRVLTNFYIQFIVA
jgi:hypothetical protein